MRGLFLVRKKVERGGVRDEKGGVEKFGIGGWEWLKVDEDGEGSEIRARNKIFKKKKNQDEN